MWLSRSDKSSTSKAVNLDDCVMVNVRVAVTLEDGIQEFSPNNWGGKMLRRSLVALGLVAFQLGAITSVLADEAATVKTLEDAKATIIRDDKSTDKPVIGVIMWGPGFKGDLLKELKQLPNLQKVRIGGPWITDDGVKELRSIKTLQMLEIRSPNVTDGALKDLQEALPKLKYRRASPGETPFAGLEEKKGS
jgi:hypothetical protein